MRGLLFSAVVVLLSFVYTAHAACDTGWFRYSADDSCYKYFTQKMAWVDAKKYCESKQAHLAIVLSHDENNFLKSKLRQLHIGSTEQVWMDGTDTVTEGEFVWEHIAQRFEITDWGTNEPNQNGGNEDCLSFYASLDFKWNDEHCNKAFPFLCEIDFEITDWGTNEPNQSGGNEDCLSYYASLEFKWNDASCSSAFPFLCERKSTSIGGIVG